MSDTPLTDALATLPLDPAVNPASARLVNALNLCAKLERKLAAARPREEAIGVALEIRDYPHGRGMYAPLLSRELLCIAEVTKP